MKMGEVVNFLDKYSWIYDFKVTNVLSENVIGNIPDVWRDFLRNLKIEEFNNIFIHHRLNQEIPDEVVSFIGELRQFKSLPVFQKSISYLSLPNIHKRGISLKKEHEIINFANFIEEKCKQNNICDIVDIGSGLGYLGEELSRRGFSVTAIEGSVSHSERAKYRKENNDSHCFSTHQLIVENETNSIDKLTSLIPDQSCLVGLHCCGDLTPDLLNIFLKLPGFFTVILVSCCYHKMSAVDEKYQNFPISSNLKLHVNNLEKSQIFNRFMLRLGAQETLMRWLKMNEEDHSNHKNHMAVRAVIEKVSKDNSLEIRKKKSKHLVKVDIGSLPSCEKDIAACFNINESFSAQIMKQVSSCIELNQNNFHLFEILTGLQFILQSIIEHMIHFDRILYLQEKSVVKECDLYQIFDEVISPRNKVIYAVKG